MWFPRPSAWQRLQMRTPHPNPLPAEMRGEGWCGGTHREGCRPPARSPAYGLQPKAASLLRVLCASVVSFVRATAQSDPRSLKPKA
jgi:hypothetical protein